ncbi:MAG: hypothetical protein ACREFE_15630, partial [Limisphaerales bacterium]
IYWRTNQSTGNYECEALLTQKTDPIGNTANLTYETYTNNGAVLFRLKQVADYDGKINSFLYFSDNPGLLKEIITPYNQIATFAYDSSGNLTNITDAATNISGISWDSNGRVTTLTTPYGMTRFNYYDADLPGSNDSTLNGDVAVDRAVTVVDPNGGTNIYAYCFDSQTGAGTPSQFDSSVIPQNTPLGTLDTGTNEVSHDYAGVNFRNSFHWDSRETASLSTTTISNMIASDFLKARMQHWLGDSNNVYQTDLLSVEQDPSPDGTTPGQLTFYDYYGKGLTYLQGTNSQVAVIARRLSSGQTYYDWKQYNSDGYVTKDISTYSLADGIARTRTNIFVYATNTIKYTMYLKPPTGAPYTTNSIYYEFNPNYPIGQPYQDNPYEPTNPPIFPAGAYPLLAYGPNTSMVSYVSLLVAVTNADGTSVHYGGYQSQSGTTTYTYYGNWSIPVSESYTIPLPTRITNAAGYVTSLTYDGDNRLTSVHLPSGLTTTNIYDSTGFLSKTIDLQIGRTNSYTYTNGLVRTWTNERGLVTTYTWDKLNRMTLQSDQEGYISNIYTRLDLTATRDKLGNWTYLGYDPLQHLVAVTNANQEVTLASYCSCGALEWLRDPMGNFTTYNSDLFGRITNIDYPDGYQINNTYNSLDQLVKTSDGIGYVTNNYNVQGLLTVSANSVGVIQSNSYDILDRPVSVTDRRGVATLLSYDAIDRVLTNIIVGISTNSFIYSTNGLVQSTDGLRANITRFQNDVLGRILLRTNANTELTQFKYDSSGNITNFVDGKLQETILQYDTFNRLTNKLDNTLTSALKLTYDADSRIKTLWTPEKGTTTYIRDPLGRIRTNSYPSDPPVIKMYNADGQLTNMVDGLTANGLGSTFFTYTLSGQPQSEGGLWPNDTVTRTYNNRLRSSLTVGSYSADYTFDTAHRLQTIASSTGTYDYTYHPGIGGSYSSPLVQTITLPNGMSITNGYDNGGRLTATMLLNSSQGIVDSEQYGYNADNWRTNQIRFDGSSINYG